MFEVIGLEICRTVEGPVSAEAVATDTKTMLAEGHKLADIAANVVVKLPLTKDGLMACAGLAREGIRVNVTLCFSAVQALLAAKAGAAFISPFIGRLDDVGADGADLLSEIRAVYDNYGFETEILAASIRNVAQVRAAALAGSDCATIPPAVFLDLFKHPLTEKGLDLFFRAAGAGRSSVGGAGIERTCCASMRMTGRGTRRSAPSCGTGRSSCATTPS